MASMPTSQSPIASSSGEPTLGNAAIRRRTFVKAGISAASAMRVLGANDRIRLGVIGTGGRGRHVMNWAEKTGQVEWVALCDAWKQRSAQAMEEVVRRKVPTCQRHQDLLERNDIDAVIIATFDNMHTPIAVDACRAGKDIYVEKPMTSIPEQGPELVKAVKDAGRIVQVGVQQRSMPHFIEAKERYVDGGLLGKVHMVRTVWNGNAGYLSAVPQGMERKPPDLDWERCLGWLPGKPWDARQYFNRFAYWDFGSGGQTGGLFVHLVDVVHWYLGLTRSEAAVALGGLYQYKDGRDTPDNLNATLTYPGDLCVTFEATLTDRTAKELVDIVFYGEGGRLHVFRGHARFVPSRDSSAKEESLTGSSEAAHMENWIACLRNRKQPNANVVDGHYSAMACHIANIAYKERRRVDWNSEWNV